MATVPVSLRWTSWKAGPCGRPSVNNLARTTSLPRSEATSGVGNTRASMARQFVQV